MNWYLAKIVFRIICGNGKHKAQFDEQLRLVEGSDIGEATAKAIEMGQKEQDSFFNTQNQLVQWRFINISEIHPISSLIDGAELYSRIEEKENAEAYVYAVHQKASAIKQLSFKNLLQVSS